MAADPKIIIALQTMLYIAEAWVEIIPELLISTKHAKMSEVSCSAVGGVRKP